MTARRTALCWMVLAPDECRAWATEISSSLASTSSADGLNSVAGSPSTSPNHVGQSGMTVDRIVGHPTIGRLRSPPPRPSRLDC